MKEIPTKFYKANERQPTAATVGELKQILDELPDTLRVEVGFGAALVSVYNHKKPGMHCRIESK